MKTERLSWGTIEEQRVRYSKRGEFLDGQFSTEEYTRTLHFHHRRIDRLKERLPTGKSKEYFKNWMQKMSESQRAIDAIFPIIYYLNHRILKKKVNKNLDTRKANEDDLTGVAEDTFLDCVKRFDFSRGYKFTTYLSTAVGRRITRDFIRKARKRRILPVVSENALNNEDYHSGDITYDAALVEYSERMANEDDTGALEILRKIRERNSAHLHPQELEAVRRCIMNGETLKTVGETNTSFRYDEVSRERVRQVENKALKKLREAFANEYEKRFGEEVHFGTKTKRGDKK